MPRRLVAWSLAMAANTASRTAASRAKTVSQRSFSPVTREVKATVAVEIHDGMILPSICSQVSL
jgi:hypothetical protein